MMAVGESTARLDRLVETANFYDKEVLTKLSNLGTILEPIIMIIMELGLELWWQLLFYQCII